MEVVDVTFRRGQVKVDNPGRRFRVFDSDVNKFVRLLEIKGGDVRNLDALGVLPLFFREYAINHDCRCGMRYQYVKGGGGRRGPQNGRKRGQRYQCTHATGLYESLRPEISCLSSKTSSIL